MFFFVFIFAIPPVRHWKEGIIHSNIDKSINYLVIIQFYIVNFVSCSDNASILGGVRLPPDTEIIKYTSSIVGPKVRKVRYQFFYYSLLYLNY